MSRLPVSEADLQALVRDWFACHGFLVMETGQYRQRQRPVNTNGCPDLLLRRPHWPQGVLLGLELKTAQGRLRAAQTQVHAAGGSIIVRSLEEAQTAVQDAERRLSAAEETNA